MIFKYFVIGIIQGLTEFLPVSSSGHILLFGKIFNVDCNIIFLSVVAHLGTLLSVFICMRKKIVHSIKNPFCKTNKMLVLATIPCVLMVLMFNNLVEKLYSIYFLIAGFLVTGILLLVADLIKTKNQQFSFKNSIFMGLMQAVAILPGISRSGSTLAVGLMTGANKSEVCDFSFLMSVPIIVASAVFETIEMLKTGAEIQVLPMLIVFVTSFVFGILSIKIMIKTLKSNKLSWFSVYLLVLAIITFFVAKSWHLAVVDKF